MLASKKGRSLLASMPRDRILTETDGPFGKLNGQPLKPWESEKCHDQIAQAFSDTADGVSALILANFRHLVSRDAAAIYPFGLATE
jgi:TatD DNase family protein